MSKFTPFSRVEDSDISFLFGKLEWIIPLMALLIKGCIWVGPIYMNIYSSVFRITENPVCVKTGKGQNRLLWYNLKLGSYSFTMAFGSFLVALIDLLFYEGNKGTPSLVLSLRV